MMYLKSQLTSSQLLYSIVPSVFTIFGKDGAKKDK